MKKVLAIIVTWNKKEYVLNLLHSLSFQEYPQDLLDILVVDNASTDNTVEAIKQNFPHVKVIQNQENLGGSGGFNTGLRYALSLKEGTYDYIWLLDNDVLVHRQALMRLVEALESEDDLGVCGSVMLQLDFPWRINEIGAFFDFDRGTLILNYHLQEIPSWRGRKLDDLLSENPELNIHFPELSNLIEVDYVAAASLLVKFSVARKAGLWKNFFIHFDDVEWCLRIARLGYGIAVCTSSLIWHLSSFAKVPTWVLYYDNRNVLEVMREHATNRQFKKVFKRISYKPFYYTLIGKPEIGDLIKEALEDFQKKRWGKKNISLPWPYRTPVEAEEIFFDPQINRILISPTVNLWATNLQRPLSQALRRRKNLKVYRLIPRGSPLIFQLPRDKFLLFPTILVQKLIWILQNLRKYDLFIQSDYAPFKFLPFTAKMTMCVNDYGFSLRPSPTYRDIFNYLIKSLRFILKSYFL